MKIKTFVYDFCMVVWQMEKRHSKQQFPWLHGCSSLQVLFDLCCVFAVEPLGLLVELGVPLVDIIDVGIIVVGTATTVF